MFQINLTTDELNIVLELIDRELKREGLQSLQLCSKVFAILQKGETIPDRKEPEANIIEKEYIAETRKENEV